MVRYLVIFSGQVQGVGFRYITLQLARQYGITGTIKNRYDEKVEAVFQGDKNKIMAIINELQNDSLIIIEDYSIKQLELIENEKSFLIIG